MAEPTPQSMVFDLRALVPAQLTAQLRAIEATDSEIQIVGAAGQPTLCSGLSQPLKIMVTGSVGPYFGMLNAGADLDLNGDAGLCCGHSMNSGSILIRGHAGASLGALARGGFIGVHGSARDACGLGLDGADVIVRQAVGARAGQAMRGGNLILGNDAGPELGLDATGGTIFLRGEAASIADNLRETKMKDSDSMRLGLLLVRAGIRAATKEFRIYRPRQRGDH